MHINRTSQLLVSGASGQLGQRVLHHLVQQGVSPERIIATTRNVSSLAEFARIGMDIRYADLDHPESLPEAFAGASRMLLISTGEIVPVGRRASQHIRGIDAAIGVGVEHIVYTSGFDPSPSTPMFWDHDHHTTELHLRASGSSWTFLRNCEYMEVHVNSFWPTAIVDDTLYATSGEGRCSFIARDDCARAAAAALADDSVASTIRQITGPIAYTIDEAIAVFNESTGKNIKVMHTAPEDLEKILQRNGVEQWLIDCHLALDEGIRLGYYDAVSHDVEELTGRAPITLRDFILAGKPA